MCLLIVKPLDIAVDHHDCIFESTGPVKHEFVVLVVIKAARQETLTSGIVDEAASVCVHQIVIMGRGALEVTPVVGRYVSHYLSHCTLVQFLDVLVQLRLSICKCL